MKKEIREINRLTEFGEFMPYVGEKVVDKLILKGFFLSPASAKYHGSYEGGLFDHSYEVAKTLVELTEKNNLVWGRPESPYLVGMFHDLCKVDNYVLSVDGYDYDNNTLFNGHGDKSILLLSSMMTLTEEEVACIRYHMGAFTDKTEWGNYTRAVKRFPNVLWTHHADMIASQIRGV